MKAKYTAFGKTVELPVIIYYQNQEVDSDSWDETLWVEREEDWYALMSPRLKNKFVRVVQAKDFRYEVEMGRCV